MNDLIIDGEPVPFHEGDSVLVALLRTKRHPRLGGCLCHGGDCPHCVATVDGVSYVRTCQVQAKPGMRVDRELPGEPPALIRESPHSIPQTSVPLKHLYADIVVIGQGHSGRIAAQEAVQNGQSVITLDASREEEAIGIYAGPLVVARSPSGMQHLHPREEVVIATGAAEIQPVAEGSHLSGLYTKRAFDHLRDRGVDLGRVVAIGSAPRHPVARSVMGQVIEFQGDNHVNAVRVALEDGREQTIECDAVSLGLGDSPRDTLVRMGQGLRVRAVGKASRLAPLPPPPRSGVVCPCAKVSVDDLRSAWDRGFHELELVKRATLAGTGTCQGSSCMPHVRSFLQAAGKPLQPSFTARPVSRQLTFEEAAAGAHHRATQRTPLDREHRKLGAAMERAGGWWRPWHYGSPEEEYWAVRERVSISDLSPLGKLKVKGPDALRLLEFLYPTRVQTIKPGCCRYALMLDERGYVFDDGLICCDAQNEYTLTFTSAGSNLAEAWVRDANDLLQLDVQLLNATSTWGAINVTGPLSPDLLALAGLKDVPAFMTHQVHTVAGIECRVIRVSFTGELSFELHHDAIDCPVLWRRLLDLGQDLGIKPHGLKTLLQLRLEKGHIIVGQDTDYDSTPRRIDHEWAVRMNKDDFIGKQALFRTDQIPLDRRLVGLSMPRPAPQEGAVIWHGPHYAGYVTSSSDSPILDKAVMLGWVRAFDGEIPQTLTIEDRTAAREPLPFYDPQHRRARGPVASLKVTPREFPKAPQSRSGSRFQPILGLRLVARATDLDSLQNELEKSGCLTLRFAPDELWTHQQPPLETGFDQSALIVKETGYSGAWYPRPEALELLASHCEWEITPPGTHGASRFVQGAIAGIPGKVWLGSDRVFILTPSPFAQDLEDRLS